jgi:histidinol-phosphatase (PHP family)
MRLLDLHVHSTCSADGISSIAEHARQAQVLNLAEVGFCEHADFDPRDRGYDSLDLARYDREIAEARKAVPGVKLRKGIEITYQTGLEDEIRAWLGGRPWDYVVAAVHLVDYADGWAIISEPRAMGAYFADHSQRQAYIPYFEELLRAVESGLADVLGHFDLVKRYGVNQYGPFDPTIFQEEIRVVLRKAVEKGIGLEINTSGLRQAPGEPYPALTVLRWYRALGGEILTLGSDAHHTKELGMGIARAQELAREAGFQVIATYKARQPRWIEL